MFNSTPVSASSKQAESEQDYIVTTIVRHGETNHFKTFFPHSSRMDVIIVPQTDNDSVRAEPPTPAPSPELPDIKKEQTEKKEEENKHFHVQVHRHVRTVEETDANVDCVCFSECLGGRFGRIFGKK